MFGVITRNSAFAKDLGLIVLRVGIGVIFMYHGWGKLVGGFPVWESVGRVMELFGIKIYSVGWGFAAATVEFCGGILLVLGLFTRLAAFLMGVVMFVATYKMYAQLSPFFSLSHPLSMIVVFASLCIAGSGRFSVDGWLKR